MKVETEIDVGLQEKLTGNGRLAISGEIPDILGYELGKDGDVLIFNEGKFGGDLRGEEKLGEFIAKYKEGVADDSLQLLFDQGGVFTYLLDKWEMSFGLFEKLIYSKLTPGGEAYFLPLSQFSTSLIEYLAHLKYRHDDFRFMVGRMVSGKFFLKIKKGGEIEHDGFPDEIPMPFSQMDLTQYPDDKVFLDTEVKRWVVGKGGLIAVNEIIYEERNPVLIAENKKIIKGDRLLYLSRLKLDEATRIADVTRSVGEISDYLAANKRIKYVFTLTWLEKWVRALGMKRSMVPVTRDTMVTELTGINCQLLDLRNSKKDGLETVRGMSAKTVMNGFDPSRVAYWYCDRNDFRNPWAR